MLQQKVKFCLPYVIRDFIQGAHTGNVMERGGLFVKNMSAR